MSTQIRRSTREIIPAGNDFTLYIHLDKWDDGQYRDFDLHTATDLRVYLICAVHNTEIDDIRLHDQYNSVYKQMIS